MAACARRVWIERWRDEEAATEPFVVTPALLRKALSRLKPGKASVWYMTDTSPRPTVSASPDTFIKDDPVEDFRMTMRIQITKAFTPDLYDNAAKNLYQIPALALLEEDLGHIKKVKGTT